MARLGPEALRVKLKEIPPLEETAPFRTRFSRFTFGESLYETEIERVREAIGLPPTRSRKELPEGFFEPQADPRTAQAVRRGDWFGRRHAEEDVQACQAKHQERRRASLVWQTLLATGHR